MYSKTFNVFIKVILYNIITIVILICSNKYILQEQFYVFKICKKDMFKITFATDFWKVYHEQLVLMEKTTKKMKEIEELEKSCVGVSVMIDNV